MRVCELWLVRMDPDRLPSQYLADEFVSLGMLRNKFVLRTPLGVMECGL